MARKRRKKRVEEPLTEDMLAELLDASDPRVFIKKPEVRPRDLWPISTSCFRPAA